MPDARFVREWDKHKMIASAAVAVGELWQLGDGRAAFNPQNIAYSSGDYADFQTSGKVTLTLKAGVTLLDGGRIYWDHSANEATFRKVNDRDFYAGRAVGDSTSGTVVCDLNVDPAYDIDMERDPWVSAPVGTQGLNTMGVFRRGGAHEFLLSATSEAQKLDMLSVDGFDKSANAIVEIAFRVPSDGAGTAVDVSVGIANDTHATDADSITDSIFLHMDANNTNINFESDDGTTEVAATDSTTDYTEGATKSVQKEVWMDMRDPASVRMYVDGVRVLSGTTFNVNASSAVWRLLAHIEKTASTDTYQFALDWFRVRFMEQ